MAVVTMKQLLDSGTHFGHQTRRWNPKMKRFIFTDRNGIYIIDLQQTLTFIDKASAQLGPPSSVEPTVRPGLARRVAVKRGRQPATRPANNPETGCKSSDH